MDVAITNELPRELDLAADRFDRQQQRIAAQEGYGSTEYGLGIASQCLPVFTEGFQRVLKEQEDIYPKLRAKLRELQPEVLALCVLQTVIHGIATACNLRVIRLSVGAALEGECWAHGLAQKPSKSVEKAKAKNARAAIEKAVKDFEQRTGRAGNLKTRLRKAGEEAAKNENYGALGWSRRMLLKAGNVGVAALLQTFPDVFKLGTEGQEEVLLIDETSVAHSKAEDMVAQAVTRRPVWLPTTNVPRAWTSAFKGGTWDERLAPFLTLVRSLHKETHAAVNNAVRNGAMKPAVDAVNSLQNVSWTINKRLFGVVNSCFRWQLDVEGIPAADSADCIMFKTDMCVAEEMMKHERFHTAMNMDWRGRVYGVPSFNFQREDRVRALFLFADGEPIGEEGFYWLKVHVANCSDFGKVSKRPFAERVAWFDANLDLIENTADVPLKDMRWAKADKPFLFVAACQEAQRIMRSGLDSVTRLPVSFDGSCSGLQHLCAMTRAPEGALVNLTPQELPQDVYQVVADNVRARIVADAKKPAAATDTSSDNRQLAQICLDYGVDRKLVKRNVMTYSYSSKQYGMAEQQREDTMRPLFKLVKNGKLKEHPFGPDGGYAASKYLAWHVYAAIEDVVHLPANAMSFLQKLAKAMAHEGKPLRWTSPVGLPWINRYHAMTFEKIRLFMRERGVRIQLDTKLSTGFKKEINKEKVANGVAPNFVHALDAAHLLRTVNAANAEGITQIATVHDSFGCLASRAPRFRRIIREEFVRMYQEHDTLAEVYEQARADLDEPDTERMPEAPTWKGSLNIEEVLDAEFAFA